MSRTVAGGSVRPPKPRRDAERKESKGKLNGNEALAGGAGAGGVLDRGRALLGTAVGIDDDTDDDDDDDTDDEDAAAADDDDLTMTSGRAN